MGETRETKLLTAIDRITVAASIVGLVVLVVIYFLVVDNSKVPPALGEFVSGIILNLIPVLFLFFVSYVLYRSIQEIRKDKEADELARKVADTLKEELGGASPTQSLPAASLVKDASTNVVYLLDRHGLPHAIKDENTALYLMAALNYEQDEIERVPADGLRSAWGEVPSFPDWKSRLPRTREDDLTAIARASLKVIKGELKTENDQVVLPFSLRYDNEDSINIESAQCVFSAGGLTEADISPQNRPHKLGLLTCTLLFSDGNESKRLEPQKQYTLNLFLENRLSIAAAEGTTRQRLGYIEFSGVFRNTQVRFHKDF